MKPLSRISFIFYSFILPLHASPALGMWAHIPDRLNFEILPVTASATHFRGMGLGFSTEKINPETETITAIQGDLSFPFMQKRLGKTKIFDGPADWNGSLNLMAMIRPTFYLGGKVGASMLVPDGPVGFMALSFRVIPKDPENWGFFNFCTKQLDMGIYANREIYAVVRLGFKLFKLD